MTAAERREWDEKMTFKPDPEIERELFPLRAMVALGKAHHLDLVEAYHRAALRKQSSATANHVTSPSAC